MRNTGPCLCGDPYCGSCGEGITIDRDPMYWDELNKHEKNELDLDLWHEMTDWEEEPGEELEG